MMKVRVNLGSVQVEAEGDTMVEAYEDLAHLEEVFGCHTECGMPGCKNKVLRHRVRVVDDNKFFELVCTNNQCRAVFRFGQHKKGGGLFPQWKTKEDDKKYKPNGGWEKWVKPTENDT